MFMSSKDRMSSTASISTICNYENGNAGMDSTLIRGFIKHYKLNASVVAKDVHNIYKKYLDAEILKPSRRKAG